MRNITRPVSGDASVHPESQSTFSQKLGEMTWLLTQSELHKRLSIGDIEWLLFPPLVLGQYKVFYANGQPVGLALWAFLTEEIANKLGENGKLGPNDWCAGFDLEEKIKTSNKDTIFEEAKNGENIPDNASLWLVDIIAPSATLQNKLKEILFADLVQNTLKGQKIHYHQINLNTGVHETKVVGSE